MTRPDAEGFYLLEHLAAGPWEVRFRQEQEQFFMTQSATPPDEPYQGDCVVFEGRTTRYDLHAQAVPIEGRLTIDGVPAARWTARLEDTQAVYSRDIAGSNVLDASGAFELVHDGRAALLVLETPETTTEFVRLTREIPDGAVGTDASLEIETGRLTGTASAEARLRLTTTIASVWHHQVVIEVGPDGSFAASVPAGRVTIAIETVEIGKFTRWVDATTAEVVAGGAVAVGLD
jgi:hypothetical protein